MKQSRPSERSRLVGAEAELARGPLGERGHPGRVPEEHGTPEIGQDRERARDVVDAMFVFTFGAMCSEWSGYDRATGRLDPPAAWTTMGYHGPVDGVADYRVGI